MVVPLHRLAPAWVSGVYPYLRCAQHTTPASLQPLRVSLGKELWLILTLEVLWRSPDLAWMPSPRFPLTIVVRYFDSLGAYEHYAVPALSDVLLEVAVTKHTVVGDPAD
jgi:hypothetical protein